MASEYHIKGTVTFEEYLECHQILAAKRLLWIRGGIMICGLAFLFYGFQFAPSKPVSMFAKFGGFLIVYGFVISPFKFRYLVKRNWDQYPAMREGFDILVSPDGLEAMDDRGNPSFSAWDSYLRFGESKSLFLLYLSPLLPLCIPKRLVSTAEVSGLRELLSSAIERKSDGKPQR